jgi:hypothetical protein
MKKEEAVFAFANGKWQNVDAEQYELYKQLNPDDWWIAKDNLAPHKYQIAAQCIARQEELYFKEWIEHHLRIGIEFIYIYDNNNIADKGKLALHVRTGSAFFRTAD